MGLACRVLHGYLSRIYIDYATDQKLLIISGVKMTGTGENEKKDKDKSGGVTIYFLLAPGKTPDTCTESLSDAYDQSDESGLTPTWINTEKALAQKPTKTVIFYFYFIQSLTINLLEN